VTVIVTPFVARKLRRSVTKLSRPDKLVTARQFGHNQTVLSRRNAVTETRGRTFASCGLRNAARGPIGLRHYHDGRSWQCKTVMCRDSLQPLLPTTAKRHDDLCHCYEHKISGQHTYIATLRSSVSKLIFVSKFQLVYVLIGTKDNIFLFAVCMVIGVGRTLFTCLSVGLSVCDVTTRYPAKTAGPIEMPFGMWGGVVAQSSASPNYEAMAQSGVDINRHALACPWSVYSTRRCSLLSNYFDCVTDSKLL